MPLTFCTGHTFHENHPGARLVQPYPTDKKLLEEYFMIFCLLMFKQNYLQTRLCTVYSNIGIECEQKTLLDNKPGYSLYQATILARHRSDGLCY